jgi:tetratricopeptide (TPR) repeat protein
VSEPTAVVASQHEIPWVLPEDQRKLLLRLGPNAFEGDRAVWGLALARASALEGDAAGVRTHAEEARAALEQQLRAAPENGRLHALLGLALAQLGRNQEAVREGERGAALLPVARDAFFGAYVQERLALVYLLAGEAERAIDVLEALLKMPYVLTGARLKLDPTFAPLRGNPRFRRLVDARGV